MPKRVESKSKIDYQPLLESEPLTNFLSFGILQYGRKLMMRNLCVENKLVVDLMCGNQTVLQTIAKHPHKGFTYLGIDKIIIRKKNNASIKTLQHDLSLPLHLKCDADIIICSYGLKIANLLFLESLVSTISANAGKKCTLSFVEFCMPGNKLIKRLFLLYLNIISIASKMINVKMSYLLIRLKEFLVEKNRFDVLIAELNKAGFTCTTDEKIFGFLYLIRCERCID